MKTPPTPQEGEYEPAWLTKLRLEDPEAAATFIADPRRISRLDRMLAGVMNAQRKVEMIRLAYNSGFDPNDALFNFVIGALNIQQLFSTDHDTHLNASRAMAEEARKALSELRTASGRVDGNVAFLNEVIETLPDQLRAWLDSAIAQASEHLKERSKTETAIILAQEARTTTAEITQNLIQVQQTINELRAALNPALIATQSLTRDSAVILGGIKTSKRELRLSITSLIAGAILGTMTTGWVINSTTAGLNPLILQDVQLGKTYSAVYKSLPHECRAYIATWTKTH